MTMALSVQEGSLSHIWGKNIEDEDTLLRQKAREALKTKTAQHRALGRSKDGPTGTSPQRRNAVDRGLFHMLKPTGLSPREGDRT